jgi:hypothetical protein
MPNIKTMFRLSHVPYFERIWLLSDRFLILQCNEVKSSAHMEKEGLIRSVEFFNQNNIKIKTLVTDRHTSIRKWICENMAQTKHCFDAFSICALLLTSLHCNIRKQSDNYQILSKYVHLQTR